MSTSQRTVNVLDHGSVTLVEVMGDDRTPAQIARGSFRNYGGKSYEDDMRLTAYLLEHKHTSPFEFVQIRLHCVMPIFVARQWIRHRTAKVNEESLRYTDARNEQYVPDKNRLNKQHKTKKQCSGDEQIEEAMSAITAIETANELAMDTYKYLQSLGLANELCRGVLPVNQYTGWMWQIDLHNLMHFLRLRLDEHAQYEIRVYAEAILDLLKDALPGICELFEQELAIEALMKEFRTKAASAVDKDRKQTIDSMRYALDNIQFNAG